MFPAKRPHSRTIRLIQDSGRLFIIPRDQNGVAPSAEPLPLPRIPLTEIQWSGAAAQRFWQRQRACLSVALMLDLSLRRWLHLLPTQSCSRQRVRWDFKFDPHLQQLPSHIVLAGSFTSAPPGSVVDAMDVAPKFDGVHAVHQRRSRSKPRRTWMFIRCGGKLMLADPAILITDDLDATLREASARIQLE